jgi:hypothetical protein
MICKHKLVSSPEVVGGAHAQAQVEAVILHTLFTTFTFYSHFFFGSLPTHANTNIKMVWPYITQSPATTTSTSEIGPGTRPHHLGYATTSWWALKGGHNISGEQYKRVPSLGLLYDDRLSASQRAAAPPTVANAADSVLALGGCTTETSTMVRAERSTIRMSPRAPSSTHVPSPSCCLLLALRLHSVPR